MNDLIQELNSFFTQHFDMLFFKPQGLYSILMMLCINSATICIITRYFYYPRSKQRNYATVLVTMATCIFMLVSLMNNSSELQMGAAMGLFAIFSIIRFRTEAIPVREMTYLFMLISVSVVNAIGLVTLLVMNILFLAIAWLTEKQVFAQELCSKYIQYDNISLIAPAKRAELIADIEKRTGLKIIRIEVGMVDFLKDSCLIRIFYDEPMDEGSSIAKMARLPRG